MKTSASKSSTAQRGSALLTVVMLTAIIAMLAGSIISYSVTEKRANERNVLALRARNLAENVALYGSEQLTAKLYRTASITPRPFAWTGTTTDRVYSPPDRVLSSAFSSPSSVEIRAGIEAASGYEMITDTSSPNYGLQVATARVPIIAKATATWPGLGSYTAHVQQDMEMSLTPLFQFGMFYNMDLELYPSQAFTVAGPVHSNKRLLVKPDGNSTITIAFLKRVTSAAGLYANAGLKALTRGANGVATTVDATTGQVEFTPANNSARVSLKNGSSQWRDHMYTTSSETATTVANFRTWSTNTYLGNLRTSAHGVTPLELPSIGTYQEANDASTPEDDRNNGRQVIEPPNPDRYNGTTWVATTDDSATKESKISYKAGLYIVVNPDSRTTQRSATLPDGTTVWLLPCSYRAWLNYTYSSGTRACTEVVLPGQPTYGYNGGPDGVLGTADDFMYRNYLPNRFTELSVGGTGTGNQLVRIPQAGFNLGSGYLLNGAHSTIGTTTLAVDTGTGRILAGEVINIAGAYRYVVAEDYPGGAGNLKIMPPGLLAAASDNATITLEQWGTSNIPSPAYNTYKATGTYAAGTNKIDLRLGSSGTGGAIVPGTAITIGSYRYLVTAAPVASGITSGNYTTTSYTVGVGPLRAAVASAVATTVDATPFDLGTGLGYRLNGAAAAAATTLTLDTGEGTILPGDTLFVDGARQLVVSVSVSGSPLAPPTSAPTVGIYPGADAGGIPDNTVAIVDPFKKSGYSRSSVYPAANVGRAFPADSTPPYFPADAYFFDMRRANSNRGHTGYSGTSALYNRYAVPYAPRPVAKIDFDMTRFRLMVARVMSGATTEDIYDVRAPNLPSGVTWTNSIFNNAASGVSRVTSGLGTVLPTATVFTPASYSVLPAATNVDTLIRPDPFKIYYAPAAPEGGDLASVVDTPATNLVAASILYDGTAPDAWYDGLAVYIHSVDAEKRAQTSGVPNRVDSGVRLWNGRGNAPSLTTATVTGFTLATNDAVYTVGHFNADGTINSTQTATGVGGYSAAYPDNSSEKLCALMGDAYTALAHPTWSSNSSGQVNGWNDALSAFPVAANNTDWETGSSATSTINGNDDGLYVSSAASGIKPGLLPNQSYPGTPGSATNIKLAAVNTEVSAALLMGIVPSNHNPTGLTDGYVQSSYLSTGTPAKAGNGVNSGGANNFPRLLDSWSSVGLYIRGSIVALYESRVAMEPFTNSRCYRAPGRYWGLHDGLAQAGHDVPLEPIVIGSNRVGFRELSAADYATKKTAIEALH